MNNRSKAHRANERMWWLMFQISKKWGYIVAWDDDVVDDFVEEFPEAKKTLIYYMIGHHVSPMLNRAAKRAEERGYISAGSIGNQDARSTNARTWCRTWRFTIKGVEAILGKKAVIKKEIEQEMRRRAVR